MRLSFLKEKLLRRLAVELTIDGDVQQRNWAVGPHAEKTRQGRHDRYFACHSFRFQDARFVTLSGAEVSESRQAELAMIDEGDEGAEDEDEEEGAGDMAEGDGAGEFVKSEEPAVAERGKALVETMRAAMPPHSTPPLAAPGGTMTLAQFDAGMEMAQDGGQLTARQKESPALEQLQQGEDFEKFSQAVSSGGAHVSIKCYVADWTQGRARGAVRLEFNSADLPNTVRVPSCGAEGRAECAACAAQGGQQGGGGASAPVAPALLATAGTAGIKTSTGYGDSLDLRTGNSGGKLVRRGELPLGAVQLVYRREADAPAAAAAVAAPAADAAPAAADADTEMEVCKAWNSCRRLPDSIC